MEAQHYYELQTRQILKTSSVFKIKQLNEDTVIFGIPQQNCIIAMDYHLDTIKHTYSFHDHPLAIETVELDGSRYILAGCRGGQIHIQPQQQSPNAKFNWILKPNNQQQNYINDILNLNNNIIVNCYNNGSIGFWGLVSGKRLHTFQNLHERYTYKLRRGTNNRLISCGSDKMVYRTDMQKLVVDSCYAHPQAIWCADQIDNNCIGSLGLMGKLLVWDVRVGRMVQACPLQGIQSSFLIAKDRNQLYFGDMNSLQKCDRRLMQEQLLSNQMMLISIECIHIHDDDLILCGRGTDICRFSRCEELASLPIDEEMKRSKILDVEKRNQVEEQSEGMNQQLTKEDMLKLDEEQAQKLIKLQQELGQISVERYGIESEDQEMGSEGEDDLD